jgi:hypothetical protein
MEGCGLNSSGNDDDDDDDDTVFCLSSCLSLSKSIRNMNTVR